MIEATGNLWAYLDRPNYALLITTNGAITSRGRGVMGRGCAREAALRFRELPLLLGRGIRLNGNVLQILSYEHRIWSFPVKHVWSEPADLALIARSTEALRKLATESIQWGDFAWVLPRPGCGNGQLLWEDVKPIVATLPDNVMVISK
jgi:hypothetical protein